MSWPLVSLGEICKPKQWKTLPRKDLIEEGYPVFGANGPIGYTDQFTHREPTILVGCRGSCGTLHIMPPMSYANGNAMALGELNDAQVNIQYLFRVLEARGFSDVITGSSQPQIIRSNINRIEIPLPPLEEQKRIAGILDQAAELCRLRTRALDKLNTLGQAIFHEMFGGGFAEDAWPTATLQEVVAEGTIVTYGIVQAGDEFAGGVPYIRTGDIQDGQIQLGSLRHTAPAIAAKFERSRVRSGEIVMSIRATVGTTALVPEELDGANLTQGTARIAPGSLTRGEYLNDYIRSERVQAWIQRQVKGATFREITLTRLREMPVVLPPLALQAEYCDKIGHAKAVVAVHLAGIERAEALFASLQHRAFRGEL